MSRCLHRIPFPWGEGIVSRCTCDIPFLISQVGDIVFRCSRGIPFPFGGGHHVPMSPLYRFFHFGGASYFDVRAGILFTLGRVIVFRCSVVFLFRWGGHHILMFPRYPFFRFGGGASCPDASLLSILGWEGRDWALISPWHPLPFEGGALFPDVSAISLFRWGGASGPDWNTPPGYHFSVFSSPLDHSCFRLWSLAVVSVSNTQGINYTSSWVYDQCPLKSPDGPAHAGCTSGGTYKSSTIYRKSRFPSRPEW